MPLYQLSDPAANGRRSEGLCGCRIGAGRFQLVAAPACCSQNFLRLFSSFSWASQFDLFVNQPKRSRNSLKKPLPVTFPGRSVRRNWESGFARKPGSCVRASNAVSDRSQRKASYSTVYATAARKAGKRRAGTRRVDLATSGRRAAPERHGESSAAAKGRAGVDDRALVIGRMQRASNRPVRSSARWVVWGPAPAIGPATRFGWPNAR